MAEINQPETTAPKPQKSLTDILIAISAVTSPAFAFAPFVMNTYSALVLKSVTCMVLGLALGIIGLFHFKANPYKFAKYFAILGLFITLVTVTIFAFISLAAHKFNSAF